MERKTAQLYRRTKTYQILRNYDAASPPRGLQHRPAPYRGG